MILLDGFVSQCFSLFLFVRVLQVDINVHLCFLGDMLPIDDLENVSVITLIAEVSAYL